MASAGRGQENDGAFITGSDLLVDGGVIAAAYGLEVVSTAQAGRSKASSGLNPRCGRCRRARDRLGVTLACVILIAYEVLRHREPRAIIRAQRLVDGGPCGT